MNDELRVSGIHRFSFSIHRFSMSEVSQEFPKTDRILKRALFRRVYEQGRKIQFRYFTAFILAKQDNGARIGVTTTRKIGNAVQRNRARRLVREAFRKNKWLAPHGVDIVINVKRPLVDAHYRDLECEFITFLERAAET
jgi:ribonuclease P protein component